MSEKRSSRSAEGSGCPTSDTEFVVLKAELDRMNTENERLRAILNQINDKYYSLKMHIMSLSNHQQNTGSSAEIKSDDHKMIINEEGDEESQGFEINLKHCGQREDKDIGKTQQQLECSSSPLCTEEMSMANRRLQKNINVDQIRKVPHEPHASKDLDQYQAAEATMKKARVSVRARSEATMETLRLGLVFDIYILHLLATSYLRSHFRWMPMEKIRAKIGQGKPVPSCLLPLHHGRCLSRSQTGAKVCGRPVSSYNHLRRAAQPPPSASSHGDGVNHICRSNDATFGTDAECGWITELKRAGKKRAAALFTKPGHNICISPISYCDVGSYNNNANIPTNSLLHSPQAPTFHAPFSSHQPQHFSPGAGIEVLDSSQHIVNAATAAIAADPNFTAAVAAAISSIIGNSQRNEGVVDHNNSVGDVGK
ncbi:UNVERIFIED_CONTAM: WRKY transcription factor 6 [Sesamum calycinum]|uniref:WRKY transcription factor 6 n=1 Tax=Sesamum calycinum TaxID=2727403 RepID=A0AAW2Q4Y2_9LAMI